MSVTHPLAATERRMRSLSPFFGFSIGAVIGDDRYVMGEPRLLQALPGWIDHLVRSGHERDEIGITLSSALIGPALQAAVVAFVGERRGIDIAPDNLSIRRTRSGWFDQLAVLEPRLAVLDIDPAAGHCSATALTGIGELRTWVASRIVALADPILRATHECVPLGLRGLWSNVGDMLTDSALWAGREARLSMPAMDLLWQDAVALLDEVSLAAPALLNRPRPFPVHGTRRHTLMQVRGTCCLYYKSPGSDLADGSPAYCRSCPLLTDEARRPGLEAWLDQQA